MIFHYFKVAWRNMRRNRLYSAINILGLGLGLAVGFVLLFWVNSEYTMNAFHSKANRIYQINYKSGSGDDTWLVERTQGPVASYARQHIPDLENVTRLWYAYKYMQPVKVNDKIFLEEKFAFAENAFFDIFDFPILKGPAKEPLADRHSAVISESTAKKYFGSEDPIGKMISFKDTTLPVTAVMKDFPASSSFQFDIIFSFDLYRFRGKGQWRDIEQDWNNSNYFTFALMKKGGNTERASKILGEGIMQVNEQVKDAVFPFRPLKDIYLYNVDGSKSRAVMVEIFFIVGMFVLLIAAINYINLVTARATQRVKEISMRKILGAEKQQLFVQFFSETGLLLFLAILTGILFVQVLLPVYNHITGAWLQIDLPDWQLWKVLLLLAGGVWILSGLYPALLLSSFRPAQAMRGRGFFARTGLIRKSLVVLQFVVSIAMFLGTVFMHRQMNFIQDQDLNLNTDHVVGISTWRLPESGRTEMIGRLQGIPGTGSYTALSSGALFNGLNSASSEGLEWPGKNTGTSFQLAKLDVDKHFIDFFGLQMVQGRTLDDVAPNSANFILNEKAIGKMGLRNPVGQTITWNGEKGTIIGVIKDFHFGSMHQELMPAIMRYVDEPGGTLYLRVQPQQAGTLIAAAETIWKKYEPILPMEYHYLNDQVAAQYDRETRASRLFDAFAIVTMLISCLGLFGLTTHSAERRVKEIGMRKVLGARVDQIAVLISTEFVKLVLIATIIAIPIAWYSMTKILENFAYRISLSWYIFALTALGALIIAVLTMSVQAVKAGYRNPVKSLRTE